MQWKLIVVDLLWIFCHFNLHSFWSIHQELLNSKRTENNLFLRSCGLIWNIWDQTFQNKAYVLTLHITYLIFVDSLCLMYTYTACLHIHMYVWCMNFRKEAFPGITNKHELELLLGNQTLTFWIYHLGRANFVLVNIWRESGFG